jgi:hypothetical protein
MTYRVASDELHDSRNELAYAAKEYEHSYHHVWCLDTSSVNAEDRDQENASGKGEETEGCGIGKRSMHDWQCWLSTICLMPASCAKPLQLFLAIGLYLARMVVGV